jgi:hypothetical protein
VFASSSFLVTSPSATVDLRHHSSSVGYREGANSRDELLQKEIRLHEHREMAAALDSHEALVRGADRVDEIVSQARRRGEILGVLNYEDGNPEFATQSLESSHQPSPRLNFIVLKGRGSMQDWG